MKLLVFLLFIFSNFIFFSIGTLVGNDRIICKLDKQEMMHQVWDECFKAGRESAQPSVFLKGYLKAFEVIKNETK